MSPAPHVVGDGHTLVYATDLMRQHHIRHLPVLHQGRLVGVLAIEDANAAMTRPGRHLLVRDAMNPHTYSVSPDAALADVALEMAHKRYDIAVVLRNAMVVGVFTTVDALRTLAQVLEQGAAGPALTPPQFARP